MQEETARLQEQEPKLVKAPALLKLMAAPVHEAIALVLALISLTVSWTPPSTMALAHFSKGGSSPKLSILLILILADSLAEGYDYDGSWVAGGDPGVSWDATASSQYESCAAYDLCDAQYTIDGTSAGNGTRGKTLCLDGPNYVSYPQWVEIDFGKALTFTRWRLWSGRWHPSSGAFWNCKNCQLQVDGALISGSVIQDEYPQNGLPGDWTAGSVAEVSAEFVPVTAQVVRVFIPGEWDDGYDMGFQLYMSFVSSHYHPRPRHHHHPQPRHHAYRPVTWCH